MKLLKRKGTTMKKNMNEAKSKMLKRTLGEAMLFTMVMLLATKLFGCGHEDLCPVTVVTIVIAVAVGITVIITVLKEVIDQ